MEPLSSTFRSELTNQTGALAKVLSLISRTLLVRRISGNMTIPPTCDEYTYGTNIGKCRVLHATTQCGPYVVPSQFIGTREVCSSSYGFCHESGTNGTGTANTDFLLFVGTQGIYSIKPYMYLNVTTVLGVNSSSRFQQTKTEPLIITFQLA